MATINGSKDDDVLHGTSGNDILNGGAGNDTYLFGRGDGHDVINETGSGERRNVIRLGPGIGENDIELMAGNHYSHYMDLVIRIKSTGETLTVTRGISNSYGNSSNAYSIQAIVFDNGSVWEWEDILKKPITLVGDAKSGNTSREGSWLVGNAGGSALTGAGGNDTLYGGRGNDSITGGAGDDILWGAGGNDVLNGGVGNDTYLFGRGDGHDVINETGSGERRNVIRLRPGLGVNDIELMTGNQYSHYMDLVIRIKSTGETLTVARGISSSYANAGNSYSIQAIEFDDGTVWNWKDILAQPMTMTKDSTSGNTAQEGSWIVGNTGDSVLTGAGGNDTLYGGRGNDSITGGAGDDILWGAGGNDVLNGGVGNDTYLFGRGDGHDVINETGSGERRNVIRLRPGLGVNDIELMTGNQYSHYMDLVIRIKSTGETLTVARGISSSYANAGNSYSIQAIEFDDGTVWNWKDILSKPMTMTGESTIGHTAIEGSWLVGDARDNVLTGGAGNDLLHGGRGDDTLHGGNGDDILWGGAGNDILNGGLGNDTYLFGRGDGHDIINEMGSGERRNVIRLREGLTMNDVELFSSKATGNYMDLIIRIKSTGETLTVKNGLSTVQDNQSNPYSIQAIQLSDGSAVWDSTYFSSLCLTMAPGDTIGHATLGGTRKVGPEGVIISGGYLNGNDLDNVMYGTGRDDMLYGGRGNDVLYGGDGNDHLSGGPGTDRLEGGRGNDVYSFALFNNSHDTIYDIGGDDMVQFELSIDHTDVFFARNGDNLAVTIAGRPQTLTVENWFKGDAYHVETFRTVDGLTLDHTQIDQLIQAMASFDVPKGAGGGWTSEQKEGVEAALSTYWRPEGR